MIFLTVGHQTPFDRLVRLVDEWAGLNDAEIFGQIGHASFVPNHFDSVPFLDNPHFEEKLGACSLVVSHAGTGTIIRSLLKRKPIVVLPRREELGETRNDHQLGTARHFAETSQVYAAFNEQELLRFLDNRHDLAITNGVSEFASTQLICALRDFFSAPRAA